MPQERAAQPVMFEAPRRLAGSSALSWAKRVTSEFGRDAGDGRVLVPHSQADLAVRCGWARTDGRISRYLAELGDVVVRSRGGLVFDVAALDEIDIPIPPSVRSIESSRLAVARRSGPAAAGSIPELADLESRRHELVQEYLAVLEAENVVLRRELGLSIGPSLSASVAARTPRGERAEPRAEPRVDLEEERPVSSTNLSSEEPFFCGTSPGLSDLSEFAIQDSRILEPAHEAARSVRAPRGEPRADVARERAAEAPEAEIPALEVDWVDEDLDEMLRPLASACARYNLPGMTYRKGLLEVFRSKGWSARQIRHAQGLVARQLNDSGRITSPFSLLFAVCRDGNPDYVLKEAPAERQAATRAQEEEERRDEEAERAIEAMTADELEVLDEELRSQAPKVWHHIAGSPRELQRMREDEWRRRNPRPPDPVPRPGESGPSPLRPISRSEQPVPLGEGLGAIVQGLDR